MFFALTLLSACSKDDDSAPAANSSNNSTTTTPDFIKLGSQTVNLTVSDVFWQYDDVADVYNIVTDGALALMMDISLVDSTGPDTSYHYPFASKTYSIQQAIQLPPFASYDKAMFEIAPPSSSQPYVSTGGTLTATKNSNGTFTLTFTNIPVVSGIQVSTASGKITCP